MKKKNILIIGSATLDEIIQNNSSVFKVGGVVTYAGLTYKKHGLHPIIVSNVASEDKEIFHLFQSEKITHHFGETESTTKFVNRLNGNARIQEMPGGASPITASQIIPLLKEVDHIHLGPLHPDDIDPSVFKSVTKNNQSVSLDVQGYVRYVDMESKKIRAGVSENLHDALHFTDMIKADVYELDVILDAFGMSVQELKDFYNLSEIAVTDAEQGWNNYNSYRTANPICTTSCARAQR